MKRSFWITLIVSAAACCAVLVSQTRSKDRLSEQVESRKAQLGERAPTIETAEPSVGMITPAGSIEPQRVAGARAGVEQLTAEIGTAGASLKEQMAALFKAVSGEGTPPPDLNAFDKEVPALLRQVENLNLDELIALAEQIPDSQAKMFLVRLAAEQDPFRVIANEALLSGASMSEIDMLDALARTDPAAALRRVKGSLEVDGSQRKGDKSRMKRFAVLMMRDDVEGGLRELMELQDIENTNTGSFNFGITSLDGVDVPQLASAMDNPEFAEIRDRIMAMTLGHQLNESGVAAAAQQAQSMPLTPEELGDYMNSLIKNDIMASEPVAMLEWIADVQPEETQLKMVPAAFLDWAKTDAVAARDWLGEQQPSELRDATIAKFARSAPNLDRESAALWTLEIQDEGTRIGALRSVVNKWRREEATAANAWLDENGISL